MCVFYVRAVLLYILIGSVCVVSWHSLGATVLSCSCIGNLYSLLYVSRLSNQPSSAEYDQSHFFFVAEQFKAKDLGTVKEEILLFNDNTTPHTTAQTRVLMDSFGCYVLRITPTLCRGISIFSAFSHHLGRSYYNDSEDVKMAVTSWLSEQAANFYQEGNQNPIVRQDKRLNKLGSYAKKQRNLCRI